MIHIRQNKFLVAFVFALGLLPVLAADIRLSGSDGTWDFNTECWLDSLGASVKYNDGDNVTIGSDFTGSTVTLNAWLHPGDIVFDNTQEIVLKASKGGYAFGGKTKSITKRGTGTLRLNSMWNYNACDWHIYGGLLTTCDDWIGDNNTFGDTSKDVTIHIYDGATLENCNNKALGYDIDTAEAEDHAVNVTVHAGGMFRPGITGNYGYPFSTIKDLVFDGGSFDFSKKGSWGKGELKVTRKLEFGGSSAYTFENNWGQCTKIAFASSRQTELCVADITGDDAADLTISVDKIGRNTEEAVVGLKKTGAGTILWNGKIYNSVKWDDCGWVGLNGKITVAEGKMILNSAANVMEGDLEVSGGELWLGTKGDKYVPSASPTTATYAGNLQVEGREIIASGTGKLILPGLFMFGGDPDLARSGEPDAVTFVARDKGEIHIDTAAGGTGYRGSATFSNLRLEGEGKLVVNGNGYWSKGAICVLGTFGFGGTTPVTVAKNQYACAMMSVNSNSLTKIDVPDITGDGETDVFFKLPIGRTQAQGNANQAVGFHKTGAGTLTLAFDGSGLGAAGMSGLNGTLAIDEGALQYSCDLRYMTFAVAAGAYLQPCAEDDNPRLANVTVAEGGGFRVKAGDSGRIRVTGNLTLPKAGIVDIVAADDAAKDLKMTFLTAVDGAVVSAPEDFRAWTFTVNGKKATQDAWKVSRKGNDFIVKSVPGFAIVVR